MNRSMNIYLASKLAVIALLIFPSPLGAVGQWDWEKAKENILRLAPSKYPGLPKSVVKGLEKRGCSIPQLGGPKGWSKPQNAISGVFRKLGQTDWAVLCSVDGNSTILVFWSGLDAAVEEVAEWSDDKNWLQGLGPNPEEGIIFSRMLYKADRKYILEHYNVYGGPKPPPIDHEGINEAFIQKASTVHYWYEGKWLKLTGAD